MKSARTPAHEKNSTPAHENSSPTSSLLDVHLNKPVTYTFSKSIRNLALVKPAKTDDRHFDFNPRDSYPDPYSLTRRK